jgi:acyl-CoA-binding protein
VNHYRYHEFLNHLTATVGNVKTPRPGMWDMLGRAKWSVQPYCHISMASRYFLYKRDEWAKHKDLDQYEAKWLYVEALLKVRILFLARYHKA